MSDKKPKYAVVAVHGIGFGDQLERKGFSKILSEQVFPDETIRAKYWAESIWEGQNDKFDDQVGNITQCILSKDIFPSLQECSGWKEKVGCALFKLGWLFSEKHVQKYATMVMDLLLDFVLYLDSEHGKSIREVVRRDIEQAATDHPEGIVVVAHSLGSLIAHDVLHEMKESECLKRIKHFITIGSPIEWSFKLRDVEKKKECDWGKLDGVHWLNMFYAQDPVAAGRKISESRFGEVDNVKLDLPDGVKSILKSYKAHCAYWEDAEVAKRIVELCCG